MASVCESSPLICVSSTTCSPADPLTQAVGEFVDGAGGLVTTGSGVLELVAVQPEGKGEMQWREFANGARPQTGERLE